MAVSLGSQIADVDVLLSGVALVVANSNDTLLIVLFFSAVYDV